MKFRFSIELPDQDVEAMVTRALKKLGTVEDNRKRWTKNGRHELARSMFYDVIMKGILEVVHKP